MIEYDYELITDMGNEIKIFKPDKIKSPLNNLVYIEGPNGSGKSTLLHILALSLHGLKNTKVHPALIKKMNNLVNSKHQKLKYQLKITNANNTCEIISEKIDPEKPEIIVREIINGNKIILTPESFERKYNLIYDIPDNPTERLTQLTLEINKIQVEYGNRLGELREYLREVIIDIRNSRDTNRLVNLTHQLDKLRKQDTYLNNETIDLENELSLLENATYNKYFGEYYELEKGADIRLKDLKSKSKELRSKNKGTGKINKEYRNNLRWTQSRINEMQVAYDKITLLLKNLFEKSEEYQISRWEKINLNQVYENFEFDGNFRDIIIDIKSNVTKLRDESQDSFQEINMYQDLINLLEQYKRFNISMAGSEISIEEFIKNLNESLIKKETVIKNKNNINNSLELLDILKQHAEELEKTYFPKLKELKEKMAISDEFNPENELIDEKIFDLEKNLKKYQGKIEFYTNEINKIKDSGKIYKIGEKELEKYYGYLEEPLLNEISNLKEKISINKEQSNRYKFSIENLLKEIDGLQKKKPHRFENYLDKLNILLDSTTILETKFRRDFFRYISDINKNEDIITKDSEQSKYYDALFSYLGKRVDMIRHIDQDYNVDKIDLIKGIITTKDGKNIRLIDMGSGQGQCAYLMGLLNTADNRPIIALFDEVAMMDSKSLEPIYRKFRELYSKNRLLAGIVVQKADYVNISKI